RNPDFVLPSDEIRQAIRRAAGPEATFIDTTALAQALLGDSIAANIFILGYAWQKGYLPLSEAAILRAIELNGESVQMNHSAFLWGRRAAHDMKSVEAVVESLRRPTEAKQRSTALQDVIERRAAFLVDYQNEAYSAHYRARVDAIAKLEKARAPGSTELTEAVARYLFKLMAFKDEFEVSRLYTSDAFQRQLGETFEGDLRLELHLAPPIPFLQRKTDFGGSRKITFGPWMFKVMKVLARLKWMRGSWFDITRFNNDRIVERRLLAEYEALIDELLVSLTAENHAAAVALARLPERIRGFGHVKANHIAAVEPERERLLAEFRSPAAVKLAAE
ncbi:MAG: DUF6537 domain-containing protein, partial [Hyphomicrobiales bacterium]